MSDLQAYLAAQTNTKLAMTEYEVASTRIELCKIKERFAEMRSQHKPLADYVGKELTREELLEIIGYLLTGRV